MNLIFYILFIREELNILDHLLSIIDEKIDKNANLYQILIVIFQLFSDQKLNTESLKDDEEIIEREYLRQFIESHDINISSNIIVPIETSQFYGTANFESNQEDEKKDLFGGLMSSSINSSHPIYKSMQVCFWLFKYQR